MSIIDLILDYRIAVLDAVDQLRTELGETDLLTGWRRRKYPQYGTLRDGSHYRFHGIGCAVTRGQIEVDFDFGRDGRVGGFDTWRLWVFATSMPDRYPDFQLEDSIEAGLRPFLADGRIQTSGVTFDSLLYLSD